MIKTFVGVFLFLNLFQLYAGVNLDSIYAKRYTKTLDDTDFTVGDLIRAPEIQFDYSSSNVLPQSKDSVLKLCNFFTKNLYLISELIVHSDCRGDSYYNQQLSLRRAQSLLQYIFYHFKSDTIFSERFIAVGKGEADPLFSCDYINTSNQSDDIKEELHIANLRIEIKIIGFLGGQFYENQPGGSKYPGTGSTRNSAYYEDLIFIADKALLEGNYQKALEYYSYAADLAPAHETYAAQQRDKIKALLNTN